jgi:glutaredoxin
MKKIEIYSIPNCPFCTRTKNILDEMGKPYIEYTVHRDVSKEDLLARLPEGFDPATLTVPQIFVEDKLVGGYNEFVERLTRNFI